MPHNFIFNVCHFFIFIIIIYFFLHTYLGYPFEDYYYIELLFQLAVYFELEACNVSNAQNTWTFFNMNPKRSRLNEFCVYPFWMNKRKNERFRDLAALWQVWSIVLPLHSKSQMRLHSKYPIKAKWLHKVGAFLGNNFESSSSCNCQWNTRCMGAFSLKLQKRH